MRICDSFPTELDFNSSYDSHAFSILSERSCALNFQFG